MSDGYPGLNVRSPSSSTTMASPQFKISGWLKAPRRVFNRILPALSGTSSANITNEDSGVVQDRSHANSSPSAQQSSALPRTDSVSKFGETKSVKGNRSQEDIFPTSHPPSQQYSSHSETNTSDKVKKAWGLTRSGLVTALRLLEKSADAFSPLKSAVGGLVACLDLAQVSYGC